jgi:uncharacterized protein
VFIGFDSGSFLLLIPAMIFAMYAQNKVQSTYAKYAQRPAASGVNGADVARALLARAGLANVRVEMASGRLTDHYDPRQRVLRLSGENYSRSTVASMAIAAHEVGHAIQHATGYTALAFRNGMVPLVNLTSTLAWPLFFLGFITAQPSLIDLGILLFTGAVLFQVITLPVELNASSRAMAILQEQGYVRGGGEVTGAREMLSAAAMTYVAAMAVAVAQLLRMMMIRGRRR